MQRTVHALEPDDPRVTEIRARIGVVQSVALEFEGSTSDGRAPRIGLTSGCDAADKAAANGR